MQSTKSKVVARIYANHRGWVFSSIDFSDLGTPKAIEMALTRLLEAQTIRRVIRGLYDYPHISKLLNGPMEPNMGQVAQALARKSGWRIQPSENTALNILGLSTQVPAQAVYLSDGPSKTYEIGKRTLAFKKRSLKEAGFKHNESELVVQALKALGQERITAQVQEQLKSNFSKSMWIKILRDTKTAPAWVCDIIRTIAQESES